MSQVTGTIFRRMTVGVTTTALVAGSFMVTLPVSAQPVRAAFAPMAAQGVGPEEVQARRGAYHAGPRRGPVRGPGFGRPGVRPQSPGYHARWGRPYWRNGGWYYRNNNDGAWVAAGIAGLALGAAVGAAAANSGNTDAAGYCMQRFQSYDPRSGTYLGYDGLRHPCP